METEARPSDALTKPRRPLLMAGVIVGAVAALSGASVGAYAIAQAVAPGVVIETPAAESTPTEDPNLEPTAVITASIVDLTLTVDGATSTDEDGTIADYLWDFGDGATAAGASASHAYAAAGTYTVTLTVTDDANAEGSTTYSATVTAPPPPPPPPPVSTAPARCPAGSIAQENDGVNDVWCMWEYCAHITLPSAEHPECYPYFRP